MNGFYGTGVRDPNFRLRFCLIVFMGIIAFGSVLFWKSALIFASEYQDLPVTHEQLKVKKQNLVKQKSLREKLIETEQ